MKSLFAFGLGAVFLASASPLAAQIGSQHALGGTSATAGMSRPLGGISAGGTRRRSGYVPPSYGALRPYAYSFYVPNYFDSWYGSDSYSPASAYPYDTSSYGAATQAPPQVVAPPAPPVIINQYFGGPVPSQAYQNAPPDVNPAGDAPPSAAAATGDNYYLIAYKNHSVYTALAYWVEDKTLNYVTSGNTHNQASLDLIDLDLTKTLNQARGVPFSITGKQ